MFNRKNFFDEIFREFESMFDYSNTSYTKLGENGYVIRYTSSPLNSNNNLNEIENLKNKLETCVENQDFEQAVKLRDQIKKLEENGTKITELENKLQKAVREQDFEKAIELRDKIKSLKE